MKRTYEQPKVEVHELLTENLLIVNSIPGGGEIGIGGRGTLDAPAGRNSDWDNYEN